ncbi:AEC family transporter [Shewanella sp. 202IG2-18]|uniref:AEC family transporter n=1 Tax=Parashewanella hymeniacidonis TaxID=2807618 RepID=UPI00195FADE9|nr:AEC family transporter [Parashewanella hymeniacidonis]MBM7070560.1 AEC family transporter [Parashewanella hymeniacidonis]
MIIFNVLTPILLVLFVGYYSSRKAFFSKEQIAAISKFIFYLCIPCLLFSGMATAKLDVMQSLSVMQSFYISALLLFVAVAFTYRCKRQSLKQAAVMALTATYSNTILIGLPIVIYAVGKSSVDLVFIIITFHSVMLFTLTYLLAGDIKAIKKTVKTVLINPVISSLTIGLIVNLLHLPIPDILMVSVKLLSEPAIAGAIFVLGANLFHLQLKGSLREASILSVIKVIVLPAMVYTLGRYVFDLSDVALQVVVLLAAAPVGVNAFFVAKELDAQETKTANAVVISTILSALSYSFWLFVLF